MDYPRSTAGAGVLLTALLLVISHGPSFAKGRVVAGDSKPPLSNQVEGEWAMGGEEGSLANGSTLGQVLSELLGDVETVELAGLTCAAGLRNKHATTRQALIQHTRKCIASSDGKKDIKMIAECLENETRSLVSDTRLLITRLKACVDQS